MTKIKRLLNAKVLVISVSLFHLFTFSPLSAQVYNQIDEDGNVTQRDERKNRNFNPHNNDSTSSNKEVPVGIHVWTVDRKFGDVIPAVVDTMPHLFMNTTFNTGLYGEFNTTGNNFTARQSRIFVDRSIGEQFMFTEPYSYFNKAPNQVHFTNTLSPLTNMTYTSCGDKQNGEDHLDTRFAVNVNKKLGFGFDLNYAYARGYFANQSTSHFGATLFASYLGDQYNLHAIFSTYHQKATENGGITSDDYVRHPESIDENYQESDIPTVLYQNWNRNDNHHLFLTHRYNLGFYRQEKLSDEEKKARKFAAESKKENEEKNEEKDGKPGKKPVKKKAEEVPQGRPDDAKVADDEPQRPVLSDSLLIANDTTRIKVDDHTNLDSLLAARSEESSDSTMKQVFVPVTSFIHTLETNKYTRTYIAYQSPENYYADNYYPLVVSDSIRDVTTHLQVKNTLALALVEGFNKYAKAGLRAFASHELRQYEIADTLDQQSPYQRKYTEHNVSIGGCLSKTQGKTLHYNLQAETWIVGEDAGQLKVDFSTDLNFPMPLLGDTVQLAAKAWLYRLNPTFYQRRYHSRHFWWDLQDDLSKETRTRIEGILSYQKTDTRLRVAIEEIQNYTYMGMQYVNTDAVRTAFSATPMQHSGNLNVMTAQLLQDIKFGPLHWDNIITYQNSSNKDVLPLPSLNIYSNLYLHFMIAKVLTVDLGADLTYFTSYDAPDFCPQLNQFAVQQNEESRVELGGYPFVNVYANMHLKRARFYIMMSNVTSGMANRREFLTPHYPVNSSVLRMGVSWNFLN